MVVRSFFLLFAMGIAAVTLIARGTIITKAGYSARWILVPLRWSSLLRRTLTS